MKQIHQTLLLAAAMIIVGLLAIFDIVPEKIAQFAPLALLALFSGAWLGRHRCCNILSRGKS